MRDREWQHFEITDGKPGVVVNQSHLQAIVPLGLGRHRTGSRQRTVRHPEGNLVLACQSGGAAYVVPVLMGDKDGVQSLRRHPELFQSALHLANAEATVEHDPSDRSAGMGLDDEGIAFAARPERGEAQSTYHPRYFNCS